MAHSALSLYMESLIPKHRVFISFHHADEYYKDVFEQEVGQYMDGFSSKAVGDGDIDDKLPTDTIRQKIHDEFIRTASVTVVLIGQNTWKRKHVDWEIGSSIRATQKNPRTGLLGILLPSYSAGRVSLLGSGFSENGGYYNPYTIPPRLYYNVKCGFAKIYSWPSAYSDVKGWIDDAFQRKGKVTPDNSYPSFGSNRRDDQQCWKY